eukprot:16432538-Heterocapsa_arctica.AAC.1
MEAEVTRASRQGHRRKDNRRKQQPQEARTCPMHGGRTSRTDLQAQGTTTGRAWRRGACSSRPRTAGGRR